MIQFRARTPRWIIQLIDLLIAGFSLALSYLIRFDLICTKSNLLAGLSFSPFVRIVVNCPLLKASLKRHQST